MQLYTFDGRFSFFISGSLIWFSFYCIVCLALRLFTKGKLKQEAVNVQVATNLAVANIVIIDMILWGVLLYDVYSSHSRYETFAFIEYRGADKVIMISTILFWITGLLFFIPKFRKSWVLSLLILLFINAGTIFSLLQKFWTDYLPSEWETEGDLGSVYLIQFLIFSFFVSVLYIILSRRKKLPYPSAWL